MSWESMVNSPAGLKSFLDKCLKNEIKDFVCITVVQTRLDPIIGNSVVFVEVCMSSSYESTEFSAFQLLDLITKYLKLFSIYDTPSVKVIKLV